jgi:hypothetical protein
MNIWVSFCLVGVALFAFGLWVYFFMPDDKKR